MIYYSFRVGQVDFFFSKKVDFFEKNKLFSVFKLFPSISIRLASSHESNTIFSFIFITYGSHFILAFQTNVRILGCGLFKIDSIKGLPYAFA
jgi:hypothetical protein